MTARSWLVQKKHPKKTLTPPPSPPRFRRIHVHRLNVVWAGPLPPARCRQGNRRYPGQHLPHDPGPLRMALNPHTAQPCCGQKHSSLLASGRQTEWGGVGTSAAAANLQATGLLEAPGMLSVVSGPPIVARPIIAVQRGVTARSRTKLPPSWVQLDGFGVRS